MTGGMNVTAFDAPPRNRLVVLLLHRQRGWVLMGAFPKPCFHPGSQRDRILAKLLPHAVGRRQRLVPFVVWSPPFQAELLAFLVKVRRVHAQQPHRSPVPVGAK